MSNCIYTVFMLIFSIALTSPSTAKSQSSQDCKCDTSFNVWWSKYSTKYTSDQSKHAKDYRMWKLECLEKCFDAQECDWSKAEWFKIYGKTEGKKGWKKLREFCKLNRRVFNENYKPYKPSK